MAPTIACPRLRAVEIFPVGEPGDLMFACRDPRGFAESVVFPYAAALAATLMDGDRTLSGVQQALQSQLGGQVPLADLEQLVRQLDERYLLDSPRFQAYMAAETERYLALSARPAAHAGGAYAAEPEALRRQLGELFAETLGAAPPARSNGRLTGLLSPHIDLHRGGPAFAAAYRRLMAESDAQVFVILGTAHTPLLRLFSVSRKDFETPLGRVATNQTFIDQLASRLQHGGGGVRLFDDELAHRKEHSIEFQVLMLRYLLGDQRPWSVVPILTGSFQELVSRAVAPHDSAEIEAFVSALRATGEETSGGVCYISGGDLAHIGRRFGDDWLLDDARIREQADDDRKLLAHACAGSPLGFYQHVATAGDARRICGLAPTYTLLRVLQPRSGELLRYGQAVEEDRTALVSFASLAFYSHESASVPRN